VNYRGLQTSTRSEVRIISAIPAEFHWGVRDAGNFGLLLWTDVHKETIVACILKGSLEEGLKPHSEIRGFGIQLNDLVALRTVLEVQDSRYVAMESTGIYWQPVYAILETALSDDMYLLVVNARHMKNVLGKKTEMRDEEWIATLLRAGLLKGSFVRDRDIRDLR